MVIYRFSENLFFANIKILQNDIERSIRDDTRAVILDDSEIARQQPGHYSTEWTGKAGKQSGEKENLLLYHRTHREYQRPDAKAGDRISDPGRQGQANDPRRPARPGAEGTVSSEHSGGKGDRAAAAELSSLSEEEENSLEEFSWAFGSETCARLNKV